MPHPLVWHTLTYSKPGAEPPLYVAGSFTEPQWVPQAMEYTQDANGDFTFTCQVHVVAERPYQYKFRDRDGKWMFDENSPVATDSTGNRNNTVTVPLSGAPRASRKVPGRLLNELGIITSGDDRSSTPIREVASTAAEVADTAQKLDEDEGEGEYSWKQQDSFKSPLFAHECFGAYDFVDDGFDHGELDDSAATLQPPHKDPKAPEAEPDINDPTIEKFPSERGSVMDTLRKIQSSSSQGSIRLDDPQLSPQMASRRTSVDSTDDTMLSTGSLSPTSPTAARRRDTRPSHSSFGKTKSAVSLGSIAEEPKTGDAAPHGSAKPRVEVYEPPITPPSEDEGGVVMRDTKGSKNQKSNRAFKMPKIFG